MESRRLGEECLRIVRRINVLATSPGLQSRSLIGVIGAMALLCGCATEKRSHGFTVASSSSAPQLEGDPRVVVPHAQRTIAQTMPLFRRCFERMHASGKIELILTIDQAGSVAHAQAHGPVPREVTHCVESRARRAHFSSPEGGRIARLDVPVAVFRQ